MNEVLDINSNSIITYTRKVIDFNNPDPTQIDVMDIAKGLTYQARFSGQLHKYYSVADHCLLVTELAIQDILEYEVMPCNRVELELYAMLHDASEAYIRDIPSPLKVMLPEYVKIEKRLMKAILTHFNLDVSPFIRDTVKKADKSALILEYNVFYNNVESGKIRYRNIDDSFNQYYYKLVRYIKEYKNNRK